MMVGRVFLVLTGACQFGHGAGGFTTNFIHSAISAASYIKKVPAKKVTTKKTPFNRGCLGGRPGNGVAALFLSCKRGPHRHTAVVTRPRLGLAL